MTQRKIDISVIIINYNSAEYTTKCIDQVVHMTADHLSYELIIVDNDSSQEDYKRLALFVEQRKNDKINLVRSRFNTGFGGGNMHGVQFAKGSYYLFLNNDTLLQNDALGICYTFMEKNLLAGVCGAQIYNEHLNAEVSFDHFTNFAREVFGKKFMELFFSKPNRKKTYSTPLEVDYVNGSFMFFRAIDFNAIGGFDTNIFLYFEESDVSYRLKKNNKKTFFIPSASYVHYQGMSIRKTGMPIATKIELKTSMFYVIRKHYGYLHYQALRVFFIFRYGLTSIVKPKYFPLFYRILIGLPLGKSLKHRQTIRNYE